MGMCGTGIGNMGSTPISFSLPLFSFGYNVETLDFTRMFCVVLYHELDFGKDSTLQKKKEEEEDAAHIRRDKTEEFVALIRVEMSLSPCVMKRDGSGLISTHIQQWITALQVPK